MVNARLLVPPPPLTPLVAPLPLAFNTPRVFLSVPLNQILALLTGPQEHMLRYLMNLIALWTVRCTTGVLLILASGSRNA